MDIDKDSLSVTILPEDATQGDCVFITIPENSILQLVELLRKGCSLKYMTRRTIGPKKGDFINIQIIRTDT